MSAPARPRGDDDGLGIPVGSQVRDTAGHHYEWRRGGRPVHLAACPCWGEDVATANVIRGRWTAITPGDATVPAGDRRYDERPAWRRWLGL